MNLILQVTGLDHDNKVAKLVFSTLQGLKNFADFESLHDEEIVEPKEIEMIQNHADQMAESSSKLGLNLSYTINLNLPATSDQAVFNAIFKSLKEHLISDE